VPCRRVFMHMRTSVLSVGLVITFILDGIKISSGASDLLHLYLIHIPFLQAACSLSFSALSIHIPLS